MSEISTQIRNTDFFLELLYLYFDLITMIKSTVKNIIFLRALSKYLNFELFLDFYKVIVLKRVFSNVI